jgi:hypothetical protein
LDSLEGTYFTFSTPLRGFGASLLLEVIEKLEPMKHPRAAELQRRNQA